MTTDALLQAPCGKFKNSRRRPFTKQTLRDHINNCPQCKQNRIIIDPNDFIGNEDNPINDMDTSDMSDGEFLAISSWLYGEW